MRKVSALYITRSFATDETSEVMRKIKLVEELRRRSLIPLSNMAILQTVNCYCLSRFALSATAYAVKVSGATDVVRRLKANRTASTLRYDRLLPIT
jgi:hypothetical protein